MQPSLQSDPHDYRAEHWILPQARPTRIRYRVLIVLFGLAAFTYLDRVCISMAAPWIIRDLQLTPVQMGMVFSIFAAAYALFEVPTGWLGDRLGARRVLARVLAWWSVFTAATGWTQGFSSLIAVRFLFGAGEAGAYPNMTRAVAEWFPQKRRGMAMGTIWMGSRLGAAITPPLVLFSIHLVGWRNTFHILGVAGILLAVLWYLWFRDSPAEMHGVNTAEAQYIADGSSPLTSHSAIPWKLILKSSNLWALNLMYFTLGFTYYLYISWFPLYLVQHRGVSLSQLALYASLPLLFSTIASMAGGLVTDMLILPLGVAWARRSVGILGCATAAIALTSGILTQNMHASVILISLAAGASDFILAAAWASCADIGGAAAGTVSGAMNMTGNIGAALSPALMGLLIEKTANWNLTFLIAAGLNLVGMVLWLYIRADRKLVSQSIGPVTPVHPQSST
jgi:sugar phosphate permease